MREDFARATVAYDAARQLVGPDLDQLLAGSRFTPGDLNETSQLLGRRELLSALPSWVWGDDAPITTEGTEISLFSRLILPQLRERVKSIVTCFEEVGQHDLPLLPLLPAPPLSEGGPDTDPGTLDQHIRSWFSGIQELLQELPDGILPRSHSAPKTLSVHAQLRQAVGCCRKIRSRVSKAVIESVLESLICAENEDTCIRLSELYIEAVDFCEKHFGTALDVNFAQIEGWAAKRLTQVPSLQSAAGYPIEIRVEHNWIDVPRKRAPLVLSPSADRPYGYVSAPFVLVSRQRRSEAFKLEYVVTSRREAWPRDWESPTPTELSISEDEWRDDPYQPDQYIYTFKLRIPIRSERRGERFEFQLGLTDAETGKSAGRPAVYSWDSIEDPRRDGIRLSWPEVIDPSNVERHPLGPQNKSGDLLNRLTQNGSFGVTAPRRFGKSTLVEFLRKKAEEAGFVVPPQLSALTTTSVHEVSITTKFGRTYLMRFSPP